MVRNASKSGEIGRIVEPSHADKALLACQSRLNQLPKQRAACRRTRCPQKVCDPPCGFIVPLEDNHVNLRLERIGNLRNGFLRQLEIGITQNRENVDGGFDLGRYR